MPAPREQPPKAINVPHDPINEQVIIAAVCVDRAAADSLLPHYNKDFFFAKGHAREWEVLQQMHAAGMYYDPATVRQMSNGEVNVEELEALLKDRPALPPNLKHHVDVLKWDKARIDGVRGPLAAFLDCLKDPTTNPAKVQALSRAVGLAFGGHGTDAYLRRATEVAREHAAVLTRRRAGHACYGYGVEGLDLYTDGPDQGEPRMVPGASPGTITVVTGVSGGGKTTTTLAFCLAWAKYMKRRVLAGVWEQGEGPSLELMAAMDLGISRKDLSTGRFSEEDQRDLLERMEELGEYVTFFKLPFGKARSNEKHYNDKSIDLIQQTIVDSKCDVFVADLMRRAFKETDPDDEEQALYRLQAMGEQLKVHQVWVHQQRLKDVENRADRRPTREGMKGSAAWVEVPDTIIGWNRPAQWKNVPDNIIEAIVLKQRHGKWPLCIEFDWDPEYMKIENGRSVDYMRPGEQNDLDGFLGQRPMRSR